MDFLVFLGFYFLCTLILFTILFIIYRFTFKKYITGVIADVTLDAFEHEIDKSSFIDILKNNNNDTDFVDTIKEIDNSNDKPLFF